MTLMAKVTGIVADIGPCTVDEVFPELEDEGYTRDQVIRGLQNAKNAGYLLCERGSGLGGGKGSVPATYRASTKALARDLPRWTFTGAPYSSVWDYAARA